MFLINERNFSCLLYRYSYSQNYNYINYLVLYLSTFNHEFADPVLFEFIA
jgi:hypothetical protein